MFATLHEHYFFSNDETTCSNVFEILWSMSDVQHKEIRQMPTLNAAC